MQNLIRNLTPNTVVLDDELLPGELMVDEKVMHTPSAKFVYEIRCANTVCLSRGIHCPHCGYRDPNCKTYRRLVKPEQ